MELHDLFLWCALGLSVVGLLAHEIVGSPLVIPPLGETEMPAVVKSLHGFSWHVGSVAIMAMVAMFAVAATLDHQILMAAIASAMAFGFTGIALALGLRGHTGLWRTPAPYIWSSVAVMGLTGVIISGQLL